MEMSRFKAHRPAAGTLSPGQELAGELIPGYHLLPALPVLSLSLLLMLANVNSCPASATMWGAQ